MNTALHTALFTSSITVVIIGAIFWAKVIRKKSRRRYEYPKPGTSVESQKNATTFSGPRKQKRRRRRSGPVTNPTLAETRGLPPVREDHRAVAEHYQN